MGTCDTCGNEYDKAFTVRTGDGAEGDDHNAELEGHQEAAPQERPGRLQDGDVEEAVEEVLHASVAPGEARLDPDASRAQRRLDRLARQRGPGDIQRQRGLVLDPQ